MLYHAAASNGLTMAVVPAGAVVVAAPRFPTLAVYHDYFFCKGGSMTTYFIAEYGDDSNDSED